MRIFRGRVFLGADEHSSKIVCEALHSRLDDAVKALGSLQQSRGRPEEQDLDSETQVELEEAIRDLASALLGREVHLGAAQPYPPNDGRVIQTYWEMRQKRPGNVTLS